MYGHFVRYEKEKELRWVTRVDGIRQRYRYNTGKIVAKEGRGRYEFFGTGKDLLKAVHTALRIVPNGFVTVSAREFIANPRKYGVPGRWITKNVDS